MPNSDYANSMAGAQQTGSQASAGGSIFGDVMQFIGAMLAEDARTRQSQYAMAQADENAMIAAQAAGDAVRRGNIEAGKLRMAGTLEAAQQASAYQGGGVDATTGTASDMAQATAAGAELDAQTAANNAAREAWGYRTQSRRFKEERELILDDWKTKNQMYNLNQIGTIGKFGYDAFNAGGGVGGGG
jgi:hypothetical protein